MDLPQLNEEGYAKASALATVPSLEGSLLPLCSVLPILFDFKQNTKSKSETNSNCNLTNGAALGARSGRKTWPLSQS